MVIPGFVATDRTTLGLQRALAAAGYRVTGWGMGLNGASVPTRCEQIAARIEAFGGGEKVLLVGWSLGGVFAREVAKVRPDLVAKVVTMGSPFSGDPRGNNAWRLYERVAGHPVDDPPIESALNEKPPVPTLAIWSRTRRHRRHRLRPRRAARERSPARARLHPHGLRRQRPRLSQDHRRHSRFLNPIRGLDGPRGAGPSRSDEMMNSAHLIPILFVFAAGVMMAMQAPTNAMLSKASGSAVLAALISFGIGTVLLLATWLASSNRPSVSVFAGLPWYVWLGGFYGACFIVSGVYATPRIGLASMITISIAGQFAMALWLDHVGAFGLAREPVSLGRLAGVGLVFAGVVLIRRT